MDDAIMTADSKPNCDQQVVITEQSLVWLNAAFQEEEIDMLHVGIGIYLAALQAFLL